MNEIVTELNDYRLNFFVCLKDKILVAHTCKENTIATIFIFGCCFFLFIAKEIKSQEVDDEEHKNKKKNALTHWMKTFPYTQTHLKI